MKKIVSVILVLCFTLSASMSSVLAVDSPQTTVKNSISTYLSEAAQTDVQDKIKTVALSFMQNSQDNSDIQIASVVPFYDMGDNITAYCISFDLNGKPKGYVLISLLTFGSDPIVEFAFEGSGLAFEITESIPQTLAVNEAEPIIRYTGPGMVFIDTGDQTITNIYTNEDIISKSVEDEYLARLASTPMPQFDPWAGILEWGESSVNTGSIVSLIPTTGSAGQDYWLMNDFSTGNVCTPTAATNMMWYFYHERGISWIYHGTGTNKQKATDIFTYLKGTMLTSQDLGTFMPIVAGAYQDFFLNWGYNFYIKSSGLTNMTYSNFKTSINNGAPIHTMLHGSNLLEMGHDVMTFGYAKSTAGTEYLFVLDGSRRYGTFVKFNYYPRIPGVAVDVGTEAYGTDAAAPY